MRHTKDTLDNEEYEDKLLKEIGKNFSMERVYQDIRAKETLQIIRKIHPSSILDIGFGPVPIFTLLPSISSYVGVEPSKKFFDHARMVSAGKNGVELIQGQVETVVDRLQRGKYDLIILNSLLHEVQDPELVVRIVHTLCKERTTVIATVPNALSFHRLLAFHSGLVSSVTSRSRKDQKFDRKMHFDKSSLTDLFVKEGFRVRNIYTYFIKVFSDAQIERMLRMGIISKDIIEGFQEMSKYVPDYGAEILIETELDGNSILK